MSSYTHYLIYRNLSCALIHLVIDHGLGVGDDALLISMRANDKRLLLMLDILMVNVCWARPFPTAGEQKMTHKMQCKTYFYSSKHRGAYISHPRPRVSSLIYLCIRAVVSLQLSMTVFKIYVATSV